MASNHVIKFIVNEEQFNRIKNNASAKGHKTISAYLRDISLNRDTKFEEMLIEIYKKVVNYG